MSPSFHWLRICTPNLSSPLLFLSFFKHLIPSFFGLAFYGPCSCKCCDFLNPFLNLISSNVLARGARRNFFRGGGKQSIHYLVDERKSYNCNQDFAKGFESKVKMILLKKCCYLGGMLSKLMQFECLMDGGLGAKPQLLKDFCNFLKKKNTLTSFESHFDCFLRPLERTKLLRLRIYLKFLNYPVLPALFICRSNSNHVLTFAYVSRRVARNSQWGAILGVWERSPQRSKILHFLQK